MSPPRLRIVTGKGGVGKTTVACAVALAEVLEGRRVLLAEVNAKDQASRALGFPPVGAELEELVENLWVVDMNPSDTMREYALFTLKFDLVYQLVFENPVVKPFLRLVPSLGELIMLGKIAYHMRHESTDKAKVDVIVVDAPSTGHARTLLGTPNAVIETMPAGPLADHAKNMRALLRDPHKTMVHLVTAPEEMPVNEAVELEQACRDLGIRLGASFVNQRLPALSAPLLETLGEGATPGGPMACLSDALRRRETKRRIGESHLERLTPSLREHAIDLPRLVGVESPRQRIDMLATDLVPLLRNGRLDGAPR